MAKAEVKINFLVGQINLEVFNLTPEDLENGNGEFYRLLDRVPLILSEWAHHPDDYSFLGGIDILDKKYRDAMYMAYEEMFTFVDRAEFEDKFSRNALEPDGCMLFPKRLIEILALPGTSEFDAFMDNANKSVGKQRDKVFERVNAILSQFDIETLTELEVVLSDKNIPHEYTYPSTAISRNIIASCSHMEKAKVGNDLWVTNGYLAEIALTDGSYPDRDSYKHLNGMEDILAGFDDKYEPAKLSSTLRRSYPKSKNYYAALQSENHTVYIQEQFTGFACDYPLTPYIRDELEPVFIKHGDKIVRIVLPVRVKKFED